MKFKSAAILALACFYGNGAIHSHARSIARAWFKHAHSFDRCGPLARSNDIPVLNGFVKHNRLRAEPIRFVILDSGHAQSDGRFVNRGLPVLDLARGFKAVKRLGIRVNTRVI